MHHPGKPRRHVRAAASVQRLVGGAANFESGQCGNLCRAGKISGDNVVARAYRFAEDDKHRSHRIKSQRHGGAPVLFAPDARRHDAPSVGMP